MTIDSHHHFWKYTPQEYGWISDAMRKLRRNFLPADLREVTRAAGIDGVISVQARQTIDETRWLLDLADQNEFIRGVVGWVPLASPDLQATLDKFAGRKKLKAVRHVVQDEPDDGFILGSDFNRGVAALKDYGLHYDILIYPRQLPASIRFVDRHPEQTFVLDHVAKPAIQHDAFEPWATQMRDLARRPNVFCKISGMATEADWAKWTPAQLQRYADVAIDAFGPSRVMFGSDWPVCLVATDYTRWRETVTQWIARLSPAEQARIMGGTAIEAYGL